MPQDDFGLELMRLYRRLRDEPDLEKRAEIKAHIDAIITDVHQSLSAASIRGAHVPPKPLPQRERQAPAGRWQRGIQMQLQTHHVRRRNRPQAHAPLQTAASGL